MSLEDWFTHRNPCLSQDMYNGVYTGNTVVYDAIQIALYMGFEEIYLLGVDMTRGDEPKMRAHIFINPQILMKI